MRGERSTVTMQSTALVHEAYGRLVNAGEVDWRDRGHFFALSAQIMRRILIDAARARAAVKRGGAARVDDRPHIDPDQIPSTDSDAASSALCDLDTALESLGRIRSAEGKGDRAPVFWGLERRGDRGSLADFFAKRDA